MCTAVSRYDRSMINRFCSVLRPWQITRHVQPVANVQMRYFTIRVHGYESAVWRGDLVFSCDAMWQSARCDMRY